MQCFINAGGERYKEIDLQVKCGDCCDGCGDCLACQAEDQCPSSGDGEHSWVEEFETTEQADAFIAERRPPSAT